MLVEAVSWSRLIDWLFVRSGSQGEKDWLQVLEVCIQLSNSSNT